MENRRREVPFDPSYFKNLKKGQPGLSVKDRFCMIHRRNHWGGSESLSGEGSGSEQTRALRNALPRLLQELDINVLLDLPCGDYSWMQNLDLPVTKYIGADIVDELIAGNRETYGNQYRKFITLDLTSDPLPEADLLLCRDCLVHLSFDDIFSALDNIKQSSIQYILATTFTECPENEDIETGDWRVLNLEKPPFNFPSPVQLINEECTEAGGRFADKSLGLWRVSDL